MSSDNESSIIETALKDVNDEGYEEGIKSFIKKFPQFKINLFNPQFNQSIDNFIYSYTSDTENCLIIQNKFGDSVETLSNMYKNVVSQNYDRKFVNFQKKRMEYLGKNNIEIKVIEKNLFPYENEAFDLIIYEDFFSNISKINENQIKNIINELKRILKKNGSLSFVGKENNKKIDSIIKESGLKIEKFWSLQKNSIPSFSGKINDQSSLEWCMKNFSRFSNAKKAGMKKKIAFLAMKLGSKQAGMLKDRILPYTIYRCYKEKNSLSLIEYIQKKSKLSHIVVQSRPKKIICILLNEKGNAKKILNFERYGKEFPKEIIEVKRIYPELKNPQSRLWMEDWFSGGLIKLDNSKEIELVIDWLINFQNNTKQDYRNKDEIKDEINYVKNLMREEKIDSKNYHSWLDHYEEFLLSNKIPATPIHGDFWINNIIIDNEKSKINVIDWEKCKIRENSLYDFMFFLTNLITKTKGSKLDIERFEKFLKSGTQEYELMTKIRLKMNNHFDCEMDLLLLFRIEIIKRIVSPGFGISIAKKSKDILLNMLKLLEEKQSLY